MNLPERHLTIAEPDPDYYQGKGHGSSPAKPSPGQMAPPTEVIHPDGEREVLRMAKRMLRDGTEVYIAADGSGRMFKRRVFRGLGVIELSEDEIVALGYLEEEGDHD